MTEHEWLIMRGLLDTVLGVLIITRFLWHSSQLTSSRARLVQLTILTLFLWLLQWLGVWNGREIHAAFTTLPIIWPLILVIAYLCYRVLILWRRLQRAQFEIDWRREYQEVLMEQLETQGQTVPPPPQPPISQ